MQNAKGFTLIELMIVVAIIGILSVFAVPSYGDYVTRSKIPDATSNLAGKRVLMEQYFQDNHSYLSGGACPTAVAPDSAISKYFIFTCTATANTYTITATGRSTMTGFVYAITESNSKSSFITVPAKANWIINNPTCWTTNAGGVC